MLEPQTYEQCPHCANETFVRLVRVKRNEGGGIADLPTGWRCASCQETVTSAQLQAAKDLRTLKQDQAALEERMRRAGLQPQAAAAARSSSR